MPGGLADAFEVVVAPPVQRLIDQLAGKRAGFARARGLLASDPCSAELGAYRLSGPLAPVICGVRLDNDRRLAFTTQPPLVPADDDRARVVILYVGKREPLHGAADIWEVLHELFDVDNPPAGHHKPPGCDNDLPIVADEHLETFTRNLRRLQRGR